MRRFRFYVPGEDGRPLTFPAPGPFWITGHSDIHTVVVAYCPDQETLTSKAYWPDAEDIDDGGEQEITFSARFPKPSWWEAPCGGCGATTDRERCIGCLHDFGTPESAWVRKMGHVI